MRLQSTFDGTQRKKRSTLRLSNATQAGDVHSLVVTIAAQRMQRNAALHIPNFEQAIVAAAYNESSVPAQSEA